MSRSHAESTYRPSLVRATALVCVLGLHMAVLAVIMATPPSAVAPDMTDPMDIQFVEIAADMVDTLQGPEAAPAAEQAVLEPAEATEPPPEPLPEPQSLPEPIQETVEEASEPIEETLDAADELPEPVAEPVPEADDAAPLAEPVVEKPDEESITESLPETKPEPKPEPVPEIKPAPKPELKPEPKPKPKPEPKPKPKREPKPRVKDDSPPAPKRVEKPRAPVEAAVKPVPKGEAATSPMGRATEPAQQKGPPPDPGKPRLIGRVDYLGKRPNPVYPRASIQRGETGRVVIRVLITPQGTVAEATVRQSSGHARLDQSAQRAARAARFKPYTENGVAQPALADIPFDFVL